MDKNFIPGTDGKIETLKYYLSFDYKVMVKIGLLDEGMITCITLDNNTSHLLSWGKILPIDDYTLFKLSENKYVPLMYYTINSQKLWKD